MGIFYPPPPQQLVAGIQVLETARGVPPSILNNVVNSPNPQHPATLAVTALVIAAWIPPFPGGYPGSGDALQPFGGQLLPPSVLNNVVNQPPPWSTTEAIFHAVYRAWDPAPPQQLVPGGQVLETDYGVPASVLHNQVDQPPVSGSSIPTARGAWEPPGWPAQKSQNLTAGPAAPQTPFSAAWLPNIVAAWIMPAPPIQAPASLPQTPPVVNQPPVLGFDLRPTVRVAWEPLPWPAQGASPTAQEAQAPPIAWTQPWLPTVIGAWVPAAPPQQLVPGGQVLEIDYGVPASILHNLVNQPPVIGVLIPAARGAWEPPPWGAQWAAITPQTPAAVNQPPPLSLARTVALLAAAWVPAPVAPQLPGFAPQAATPSQVPSQPPWLPSVLAAWLSSPSAAQQAPSTPQGFVPAAGQQVVWQGWAWLGPVLGAWTPPPPQQQRQVTLVQKPPVVSQPPVTGASVPAARSVWDQPPWGAQRSPSTPQGASLPSGYVVWSQPWLPTVLGTWAPTGWMPPAAARLAQTPAPVSAPPPRQADQGPAIRAAWQIAWGAQGAPATPQGTQTKPVAWTQPWLPTVIGAWVPAGWMPPAPVKLALQAAGVPFAQGWLAQVIASWGSTWQAPQAAPQLAAEASAPANPPFGGRDVGPIVQAAWRAALVSPAWQQATIQLAQSAPLALEAELCWTVDARGSVWRVAVREVVWIVDARPKNWRPTE